MVISYGIAINLAEVQWKNQVVINFAGNKAEINAFMGNFSSWTGIVTILFALFVGSNILRRFGWFVAAVFTPIVILIFGGLFFFLVMGGDRVASLLSNYDVTSAGIATIVGAVIVIASKAAKYCLFDPTKEMAYIPLDDELKTKGKAAVDVIGGRLGKSGGAFVQSTLLILLATSNVINIVHYSFWIFAAVCLIWIYAVKSLSKRIAENENKLAQK